MIIKSLRATNFMKFKDIDIRDLPEKGEIAVIGENEAGKTTLGECFAFALFGRTVRTEETDPAQVINWNADECETSISIKIAEKGVFRIERAVSRSGALSARIYGPDGSPLAEDLIAVNRILPRILGFNFPEFRYSFYVAQKEIDIVTHSRRDNTRQIVYDMLGITAVNRSKTLVDNEIAELKQKTETLDRDLAVARALKTSVAVEEETLKQFDNKKLLIEDDIGKCLAIEKQAHEELERNRLLVSSHREVLRAYDRFQGAFLTNHYRTFLSGFASSLEAVRKFTNAVATETNKEILRDEKSYSHNSEKMERLRAGTILVKELKALINSRAAYLSAELKERDASSSDFIPRTKAEYKTATEKRVASLNGSKKQSSIFLAIFTILSLAFGGIGLAVLLEALKLPEANLPMKLTGQHVGALLTVLGVIFLFSTITQLLRRSAYGAELKNADANLSSLRQDLQKISDESASCAGYRDDQMNEVEAQIRRINNESIDRKFDEIQSAAKDLLDNSGSVDELLNSELDKEKSLRAARDKLNPRLSLSNRLRRQAVDALNGLKEAVGEDLNIDGTVDPQIEALVSKEDLNKLEGVLDDLVRQVIQGLIVLDSLVSTNNSVANENPETAKADGAKSMHRSLVRFFNLCKDSSERQSNFESRSRLPKLLKIKGDATPNEVKEGLHNEGKLLREVLGELTDLDKIVAGAEERLQRAAGNRTKSENKRVSLFARTENIREQMERADELTIKIAGLENALSPIARDLAIRQELVKLYDETVEGMKSRFGPNLAHYIELLLPRITKNRYRRVQLSADLDIKVYSSERADYVRLIDLSFGTSDQILLALRLGLAQGLVHSRGIRNGEQFMFLDEPLAAFDEQRAKAFLELMRSFDDNFAQIFISSTRPINDNFEAIISLKVSQGELVVSSE
jgi:DNA repair exonuclease SbcCD ATPase subunit